MSGAYGRCLQISQASCNHFCLVIKETCSLALSWQQYLELIIWFSRMAHNRGLPSNPTIHTTSSSLNEDRFSVWLVHFPCSTISSIPYYCTVYTFITCHDLFFKSGMVSLSFSRKLHMEIQARRFFLLNLCGTQTSEWLT